MDLVLGRRRVRFQFYLDRAIDSAVIRVKSEMGQALSAGQATFSRLAGADGEDVHERYIHRCDLPGEVSLYELAGAAPLLRMVEAIEGTYDLAGVVERLLGGDAAVSPAGARAEWIEDGVFPPVIDSGSELLSYNRLKAEELRAQVYADHIGFLVFNEFYDPGWRATVDGDPVSIHRTNALCQGVRVLPGTHSVCFRYWPRGLSAGLVVSTAGCLLVLAGFYFPLRRPSPRSAMRGHEP
jgi:hypothetical protein